MKDRSIQRVHALRLRGQWTASADDGVRIGHGAGFSWNEAVKEAIRDLDEKHQDKERSCGTA
jgi:hypothetical protein